MVEYIYPDGKPWDHGSYPFPEDNLPQDYPHVLKPILNADGSESGQTCMVKDSLPGVYDAMQKTLPTFEAMAYPKDMNLQDLGMTRVDRKTREILSLVQQGLTEKAPYIDSHDFQVDMEEVEGSRFQAALHVREAQIRMAWEKADPEKVAGDKPQDLFVQALRVAYNGDGMGGFVAAQELIVRCQVADPFKLAGFGAGLDSDGDGVPDGPQDPDGGGAPDGPQG